MEDNRCAHMCATGPMSEAIDLKPSTAGPIHRQKVVVRTPPNVPLYTSFGDLGTVVIL